MEKTKPRGRPRSFHDKTEQNTVQSLDRALLILRAVSEARVPLAAAECWMAFIA